MFDLLTDSRPALAENTSAEARAKLVAMVAPVVADPFYTRADLEEIAASISA